jgi:hypothetical protein
MVQTCISLTEGQWRRLALISVETGLVKTEIVRRAVDLYFREYRVQMRKSKQASQGHKRAEKGEER